MAKQRKKKGSKKVLVQLIPVADEAGVMTEPYRLCAEIVAAHHDRLAEAKIALLWRKGLIPDADGRLALGKARKASDLERECGGLEPYDFAIQINYDIWPQLDDEQRRHLIDHELCHCEFARNDDGDPRRDERGRFVTRMRGHDIEEFAECVSRHGYHVHAALENFAREILRKTGPRNLFNGTN
jgi:hypothetical protein